jgi:hypothetical protein
MPGNSETEFIFYTDHELLFAESRVQCRITSKILGAWKKFPFWSLLFALLITIPLLVYTHPTPPPEVLDVVVTQHILGLTCDTA